ncbi:MAG: DUF3619 family protein [Proteobacteria bacterium]|nr:DUF3619 family protein [Pseudomonadota bacterium]HQR02883.1 DUF3619 family protein [Rhodocyclaceae bacterium]
MNSDHEIGLKIARVLDQGCDSMRPDLTRRLAKARQAALARPVAATRLASIGGLTVDFVLPQARVLVATVVLMLGMVGTYYWNSYSDADDNIDVDSALLTDELPVAAYTDQGFRAWLAHHSSLPVSQ